MRYLFLFLFFWFSLLLSELRVLAFVFLLDDNPGKLSSTSINWTCTFEPSGSFHKSEQFFGFAKIVVNLLAPIFTIMVVIEEIHAFKIKSLQLWQKISWHEHMFQEHLSWQDWFYANVMFIFIHDSMYFINWIWQEMQFYLDDIGPTCIQLLVSFFSIVMNLSP